jgi:hypothetical protein
MGEKVFLAIKKPRSCLQGFNARRTALPFSRVKFFFHPDFTVGPGVTPDLLVRACGLYRRWGIAPRPEELQGYYTTYSTVEHMA